MGLKQQFPGNGLNNALPILSAPQQPRSLRPLPPAPWHPVTVTPGGSLRGSHSSHFSGLNIPRHRSSLQGPYADPAPAPTAGQADTQPAGIAMAQSLEPTAQRNSNKIPTCFRKHAPIPSADPPASREVFRVSSVSSADSVGTRLGHAGDLGRAVGGSVQAVTCWWQRGQHTRHAKSRRKP